MIGVQTCALPIWSLTLSLLQLHLFEMVELTPDQTVALEKMRTAFPAEDCCGLQFDDSTFLRYLRARTFDFAKSSAMLNATIKWREEAGLGDMHKGWTSIIEKENSTGKMYARGFSKEGHALLYMKPRYENTNDHDGNVVSNND